MSTTTVNISAAQVKDLREKTGAPMMDCKQALTEAKGDLEAGGRTAAQERRLPWQPRSRPRDQRRLRYQLHPRWRQDWRAARSELRKRFRRAHRGLQGTGARHCHAHCGERSEVCPQGRRHSGSFRAREGHLSGAGGCHRQAGAISRKRWLLARWKSSTRKFAFWSSLSSRTRPSASRS